MKTKTAQVAVSLIALAALAVVGVSCSTLAGCVTSSHVRWSFIQAVGGIRVGEAQPGASGSWTIPIECDVSGLTAVTTRPTTLNSALAVRDVRSEARQGEIRIWIVTCVVSRRHPEPHWARSISLKGVKAGRYLVQYLDPDGTTAAIRSIELRETGAAR